ncbi:conserved hypothetical protein [delta proteobacterium NaphS2]|nr:conserved hypothetical protein [delta proteobacterium NaphS2]
MISFLFPWFFPPNFKWKSMLYILRPFYDDMSKVRAKLGTLAVI